jgi:hypothetical protein
MPEPGNERITYIEDDKQAVKIADEIGYGWCCAMESTPCHVR